MFNFTPAEAGAETPPEAGESGLLRYGITHLSPSSINKWIGSPAAFVLDKVLGATRFTGNRHTVRGHAVEAGLIKAVMDPTASADACADLCAKEFEARAEAERLLDKHTREELSKSWDVAVQTVEACAVDFREAMGTPIPPSDGNQHRVVGPIPTIAAPVDMLGYLDLWTTTLDGRRIVVDVKSAEKRNVSGITNGGHRRQFGFYGAVTGDPVFGCYVAPKGMNLHELPAANAQQAYADLLNAAARIDKFLGAFETLEEMLACIPIDFDSFYLRDDIETARKMFL